MSTHKLHKQNPTTLHRTWLRFAQFAWLLLIGGALFLYALSIPQRFIQLSTVSDAFGSSLLRQLGPAEYVAFSQAGISMRGWAGYVVACEASAAIICFTASVFIFRRNAHDWMAMLAALLIGLLGTTAYSLPAFAIGHPSWRIPVMFVSLPGAYSFLLFLYLFPNGLFVPSWTRTLVILYVPIYLVSGWWFFSGPMIWRSLPMLLLGYVYFASAGVGVYGQMVRYRQATTQEQRQQIKWVVFGLTALFCMLLVTGTFLVLAGFELLGRLTWVYYLITPALYMLGVLVFPLAISIAILRYKLWDIDVIIRRTLMYVTLTVTLAAIYVGSVVVVQRIVQALSGASESHVATVASTLLIAALFQPLRRRCQYVIDRRFYRRKYDAQITLHAFTNRLRDEVELDQLTDDLVQVVDETLQPAHVSLWLRKRV